MSLGVVEPELVADGSRRDAELLGRAGPVAMAGAERVQDGDTFTDQLDFLQRAGEGVC